MEELENLIKCDSESCEEIINCLETFKIKGYYFCANCAEKICKILGK